MPRETKYCVAPRAWNPGVMCGKPFLCDIPTQLYCSRTCANRAHRLSAARNALERKKTRAEEAEKQARADHRSIVPDIAKAQAKINAPVTYDPDAELAKLGYASDPKDLSPERRAALGLKPDVDRSAEPKSGGIPQFDVGDLEDDDPLGYGKE